MHIHLDPVGGMAGDMFVAALLDAFPPLEGTVQDAVRAAGLPERFRCDLAAHADHALTGKRFLVREAGGGLGAAGHPHSHPQAHPQGQDHTHGHPHGPDHDHAHGHARPHHDDRGRDHPHEHPSDPAHGHKPFSAIREALQASRLDEGVRRHAVAIFTGLAEAEAQVHGMTTDTVTFHEVGEWDSVADIVAAAAIIHALHPSTWSIGALPLGAGFVKSAHGLLPVPAPATTLLLRGLLVRDDGIFGERVTPTGAAIVRHLISLPGQPPRERTLLGTGLGFGTRILPGLSNCVRALVFDVARTASTEDQVTSIEFEVDDQTPEDLAMGLDHVRAQPGVLDVIQATALGKKGRIVIAIRVLCQPSASDEVAGVCFAETTTLGLRLMQVRRQTLTRRSLAIDAGGRTLEVKVADRRAAGSSAKVEAESLREVRGHQQRQHLRRAAENQ